MGSALASVPVERMGISGTTHAGLELASVVPVRGRAHAERDRIPPDDRLLGTRIGGAQWLATTRDAVHALG